MFKRTLLATLVATTLAGCAIGPDYTRPVADLPTAWPGASANVAAVDHQWWTGFGDPVLDSLVGEALTYNRDLAAAAARVDEARAAAGLARANLLPALNANAGYQRARQSAEVTAPGTPLVGDVRQANAVLSWELDLWGRLRRANEAARAEVTASAANRDALQLSLAAQVAQTYFQLRALDAQYDIARRTLESREEALRLREKRYRGGMTSELDYRQAEAEAASARSTVPSLRQSVEQTEHALAVLVGRSPRALVEGPVGRGKALGAFVPPPVVPAGLPSDLLVRRADVAAAEAQLVAANARIGVARAAYLPTISLTGALGSESTSLSGLFSGPARTWSFVGNLAAPIFDFGRTAAGVEAANARQRQALAGYERALQTAFAETLDALSQGRAARERQQAEATRLAALNEALRLARLRYDNGYATYLDVLDAERGVFQAELSLVDTRLAALNASVSLYKALGGGWQQVPQG
ncbi:efflux transporter outer membrane subunit [Gulbenkiania mobilis]|uniref:Multidrug efflux system outer membrane protein n=1 Tax=Gulbenkiania mobilis TaxID=397457 RepID=A0ABY2CWQ2_GULMO|nr:multidrug efflux system outer membrane protein [Gulbenkiania mobilis]